MSTSLTHILLILAAIVTNGSGLRDVKISVPHAVRLGAAATLSCQFLLDGDALYSVKWYKGGREFYRYTPKETPALKVFPMPGLNEHDIKKEESNSTHVSLREVSGSMAGSYSCEVSADAPSFQTAVVSSHLDVVEAPSGQPVIHGVKPRYRPGDLISANCTSPGSKPAANLTWTINGKTVQKELVRQYREVDKEDMEVSIATIRLPARPMLFPEGRLKIKCIASIYNLYWQTTEKTLEMERGRGHPNEIYDSELMRKSFPGNSQEFTEFSEQGIEKSQSNSGENSVRLSIPFIKSCIAILFLRFILQL